MYFPRILTLCPNTSARMACSVEESTRKCHTLGFTTEQR